MSGQAGLEVVLSAGRSKTDRVQFNAQVAATRAIVGAATTADWSIAAPGLDAEHAEIAWDGAALWVRDNGSRTGTWVGSQKLTQEWRALAVGEQIRLGQAMLTVQAVGGASGGDEEFDDEATRVTGGSGGGVHKAPSTDNDDGESTMIVNTVQQPSGPVAPSPAPGPAVNPRVNTMPPKVNVAKPVAPQSNVATVIGENNEMSQFAQSLHAQMQGGAAPPQVNAPVAPVNPMNPMGQGGYPPMAPMNPMGQMPMNPMGGYPPGVAPMPSGDFGPMPSEQSIFGSIPPPEGAAPKNDKQQKLLFGVLPPRTGIMLSVALVVALGVLFYPDDPPPARQATPIPRELTAPQPAWQQPIPGPAAGEARVVHMNSNAPPPPPTTPPGTRPPRNAPPPPPQTSYAERRAADLVVQNRIREAIPVYQSLQIAHPDQPVYRDILILLHRKLEAQLCPPGSPAPCPNAPAMPTFAPAPTAVPAAVPGAVPGAVPSVVPQPGVAPQAMPQAMPGVAPGMVPVAPQGVPQAVPQVAPGAVQPMQQGAAQ